MSQGCEFLTLEDEAGPANIIVRPDVFERRRALVMRAPFPVVEGVLPQFEGSTSVRAERVMAFGGDEVRTRGRTTSGRAAIHNPQAAIMLTRFQHSWTRPSFDRDGSRECRRPIPRTFRGMSRVLLAAALRHRLSYRCDRHLHSWRPLRGAPIITPGSLLHVVIVVG